MEDFGASSETVDCYEILQEIGLTQYAEAFKTNFAYDLEQENLLSLKKLSNLKSTNELSRLNITNFEHQKIIMESIRSHLLKRRIVELPPLSPSKDQPDPNLTESKVIESNPERNLNLKAVELNELPNSSPSSGRLNIKGVIANDDNNVQRAFKNRRHSLKARNDFQMRALESIQRLRVPDQSASLTMLRNGDLKVISTFMISSCHTLLELLSEFTLQLDNRSIFFIKAVELSVATTQSASTNHRRWSHDGLRALGHESLGEAPVSDRERAQMYGNMAQEFDIVQRGMIGTIHRALLCARTSASFSLAVTGLEDLQATHLKHLKQVVGCEIANILFVNERTRDLLLYAALEKRWFRVPMGSSIAGACATSGQCIHIPDAYRDPRFNQYVRTRRHIAVHVACDGSLLSSYVTVRCSTP